MFARELVGDGVVGQEQLAGGDLERALVGDFARVDQRCFAGHRIFDLAHGGAASRRGSSDRTAFLETHALRVVEVAAGLEAEQDVLRGGILLFDVVDVVGGDGLDAVLLSPTAEGSG